MGVNTKGHSVVVHKTVDSIAESKKNISIANEHFANWNYEISVLANKIFHTPQEVRRLAQLNQLLFDTEQYDCFFPVHKMSIYQNIITGDFMRSAQVEKRKII